MAGSRGLSRPKLHTSPSGAKPGGATGRQMDTCSHSWTLEVSADCSSCKHAALHTANYTKRQQLFGRAAEESVDQVHEGTAHLRVLLLSWRPPDKPGVKAGQPAGQVLVRTLEAAAMLTGNWEHREGSGQHLRVLLIGRRPPD